DLLARLQYQWPFILEDEAQDSSQLQEKILKLLAQPENNWVRVGDPNQAIFESFTTANPQHLRDFMDAADSPRELPNSGRSTQSIIDLANYLIDWSCTEHPNPDIRNALAPPFIEVVPPGEGGSNPQDTPENIHLINNAYTPAAEVHAIANSVQQWLGDNPNKTVAVLVPRNVRGFAINDALRQHNIPTVDSLLRSSSATRFAAGALANMLRYLSDPKSARYLSTTYKVWRRADREDVEVWKEVESTAKILLGCRQVEDFIMPTPANDWLETLDPESLGKDELTQLKIFRSKMQHWQRTIHLPIDQLILTLSQELFTQPSDLAVAHKLAILLRSTRNNHPDWHLPALAEELAVIAKNERRFLGFSDEDSGFDPDKHKGEVVIATVHKAKGLEWDRVYLMSVNNYDYPSGEIYDHYISERWFIRDNLNLESETLAQLETAFSPDEYDFYEEGIATYNSRMEYVRERLRLLYVGITRARRELVVTWNDGQRGQRKGDLQPALPFVALQSFWEKK
ncbi:MAG: ATP-dependent helicase, partial [Chloroflexota bacterium]